METEQVKRKDGTTVNVVASKEDMAAAKKAVSGESAPVYPNINHPVAKGHDLAATGADASTVLVDGEGAHNSPLNAVNPDGSENGSKDVKAAGLNEAAYKQVPMQDAENTNPVVATDAEVKEAKAESAPANEVTPEGAETVDSKESK